MTDTDAALMRRVLAGEPERFAELVGRHQPLLLRLATARLGRRDWAEDAVQETLLAAFRFRHTYNPEYTFAGWLRSILFHECTRLWNRTRREALTSSYSAADEFEPRAAQDLPDHKEQNPLQGMLAGERAAQLNQLLSQLSTVQAQALRLRFFGELKFEEIAERMGCSLGTAKNRVRWGLLRLAELIRDRAPNDTETYKTESKAEQRAAGPFDTEGLP